MNERLKILESIFRERVGENNPVNNLQDVDNLRVLVWTFSKTGTSTLAGSFQKAIDGGCFYKNVTHSHHERCWFRSISGELQEIDFSFDLLIEFINSKGIKPLVVQSFRCPLERLLSSANHLRVNARDYLSANLNTEYIDYLKKTFEGLWTHSYNKERGFGFHSGNKYDILYVTTESINMLPENIKLIKELNEYHNLKVTNRNVRKNTGYQRKIIDLSEAVVHHLYDLHSEPLNFFYTQDQIFNMQKNAINQFTQT